MRSRLTVAAFAMLAAASLALAAPPSAAPANPSTVQQVTERLACQCGCGLTVANCNHPNCSFAIPVRAEIDQMLRDGANPRAVVASFRDKYGEKVLAAPTAEGFNLLAWIMPFVALLAGGAIILLSLRRWRAGAAPVAGAAVPPGETRGFDAELRKRLERDVKDRL
jgi:cytochrome c-type biogenesis protein CcmH